jgi:hypothetical protein
MGSPVRPPCLMVPSDGYQQLAGSRGELDERVSRHDSGLHRRGFGTLACLVGLAFLLLITKIANWRLVVGCLVGMIAFSTLLNRDWLGHQPDVCNALALASSDWRLRVWFGVHGHRAGLGVRTPILAATSMVP